MTAPATPQAIPVSSENGHATVNAHSRTEPTLQTFHESKLLERFGGGHGDAANDLFRRNQQSAFRVARRLLGNEDDALDAVQEGLVKALIHLKDFQGQASFKTWLMHIVRNAALELRRKRERRGRLLQRLHLNHKHDARYGAADQHTPLQEVLDREGEERAQALDDALGRIMISRASHRNAPGLPPAAPEPVLFADRRGARLLREDGARGCGPSSGSCSFGAGRLGLLSPVIAPCHRCRKGNRGPTDRAHRVPALQRDGPPRSAAGVGRSQDLPVFPRSCLGLPPAPPAGWCAGPSPGRHRPTTHQRAGGRRRRGDPAPVLLGIGIGREQFSIGNQYRATLLRPRAHSRPLRSSM